MLNKLIISTLPYIPKPIVGFFASRYIAGERLEDAVHVVQELNSKDIMATIDVLGENITRREEALEAKRNCEEVLHTINQYHLDSNLSIKLTQFGLKLDKQFCLENVREIVRVAMGYNNFVRIDMEDSTCTTDTLDIYCQLRKEFDNVGCVIQAYLKRSEADVKGLLGHKLNVRLCKGIYIEPPEIAIKDHDLINKNFILLMELILKNHAYIGIATHDDALISAAYRLIKELQLKKSEYEFQMLLGVRPELRDVIVRDGHRMRVYVPFGKHWYSYSVRRLKENPQIAGYIVKSIFSFGKSDQLNGRKAH